MLPGKIEIGFAKRFCLQASVDVTFEGQQRPAALAGVVEAATPGETGGVQVGKFIADAHQRSDGGAENTRFVDQLLRVVQQSGWHITFGERALVVERFGR